MVNSLSQALLTTLDEFLGNREATCEVLALVSAALLTASPHGVEHTWLNQIRTNIRPNDRASEIKFSSRFRQAQTFVVAPEASQRCERAVRHLLETLELEYQGETRQMLAHLCDLVALALTPDRVEQWTRLVSSTHKSVQCGYLQNHLDLN
jgi:hypothetical protein